MGKEQTPLEWKFVAGIDCLLPYIQAADQSGFQLEIIAPSLGSFEIPRDPFAKEKKEIQIGHDSLGVKITCPKNQKNFAPFFEKWIKIKMTQ